MSDSSRLHGPQPTRLYRPWDFPGKSTGVGCHCLLLNGILLSYKKKNQIMPLAATWGKLDAIILSEVTKNEKDKYHVVSFIRGI